VIRLDQFISETFRQIIDGVRQAQEHAAKHGAAVNPPKTHGTQSLRTGEETRSEHAPPPGAVEFDLAVTEDQAEKTKGGIGVFLGPFGLGTQGESGRATNSITRIRFSIPYSPPVQQAEGKSS